MEALTNNAKFFFRNDLSEISSALSGQLMAVKNLKIIFRKFFRTLTNHKLIIVNCKSVSVMTAPLYYGNQIWSSWRFYLLAFSHMTSMTQDFKKILIFFGYFRTIGYF